MRFKNQTHLPTSQQTPNIRPGRIISKPPVAINRRNRELRPDRFPASFPALDAHAPYPLPQRDDGRLWVIALIASVFGNALIFGIAAFASIEAAKFRRDLAEATAVTREESSEEASVTLSPDMFQTVPEKKATAAAEPTPALPQAPAKPDFTRTSEEQRGKRPDKPAFLGERDTQATSDNNANPDAPPMPSQKGIEPRDETDVETTESQYRDGPLEDAPANARPGEMAPPTPPTPDSPPVPEPAPPQEAAAPPPSPAAEGKEIADKASPEVPPMKELIEGPNPVEVPVQKPAPEKVLPPSPPSDATEKAEKTTAEQKPPPKPKVDPTMPGQQVKPGFRGYQRKTAIRGSISRTGRSALDVADSPLGRYQAVISRAVEQEWQRNCVRHRDFITPGFLTVRFFVETSGRVKSVQFVGEMQTGEVQKGFTLNSIRDASIPAMPAEIRGEYKDEPLELIFNFYF